AHMKQAGVPVVSGSDGPVDSLDEAGRVASPVGYPLMLKAAAGGGGIRLVKGAAGAALAPADPPPGRRAPPALGPGAPFLQAAIHPSRDTSRCRSSVIATATWCICTSAIAPSSAATRRSSRRPRLRICRPP